MTDGKLEALRRDPVLSSLDDRQLLWLGRVADLLDLPPGEVLSPADQAERWGYYCSSGRLHVLLASAAPAPAAAPCVLLPSDLVGTAVVAAEATRVIAFPARVAEALLAAAPGLTALPRLPTAPRVPVATR